MYMSAQTITLIFICVTLIILMIPIYILGYKMGRQDEGEEWAKKKDYYEWLLEMKKRQDFEEVKIVPKKPKKAKKIRYCDICGDEIKTGTICDRCRKVVS